MKIKVCGLKDPENINDVAGLAPEYMGFIFYQPSPRYVNNLAPASLAAIPESINKTAVFVNENKETIDATLKEYKFTAIQLHGNESPEFCAAFKGRVEVIKAFGIDKNFNFDQLKPYQEAVDYFLFDTKTDRHGGSGSAFNWQLLNNYNLDVPFFLSGGISLDNIDDMKRITNSLFCGIDLNSRFELQPGLKDIEKLTDAFNMISEFDIK